MTTRARLWGFQGSFAGNEDVLVEAEPLLTVEGDEGIWIPVEPNWKAPGKGLHFVPIPEECGTSLAEAHLPLVNPGEVVFLIGPSFGRQCKILGIRLSLVPVAMIRGFTVGVATPDTIRNARRSAANYALATFDDCVAKGSSNTTKQKAAWDILNVDDTLDPLERLTRVLHGEFLHGTDALVTAAQVEASGRGLEADLLVERTRAYAAAVAPRKVVHNGIGRGIFGSSADDALRSVPLSI